MFNFMMRIEPYIVFFITIVLIGGCSGNHTCVGCKRTVPIYLTAGESELGGAKIDISEAGRTDIRPFVNFIRLKLGPVVIPKVPEIIGDAEIAVILEVENEGQTYREVLEFKHVDKGSVDLNTSSSTIIAPFVYAGGSFKMTLNIVELDKADANFLKKIVSSASDAAKRLLEKNPSRLALAGVAALTLLEDAADLVASRAKDDKIIEMTSFELEPLHSGENRSGYSAALRAGTIIALGSPVPNEIELFEERFSQQYSCMDPPVEINGKWIKGNLSISENRLYLGGTENRQCKDSRSDQSTWMVTPYVVLEILPEVRRSKINPISLRASYQMTELSALENDGKNNDEKRAFLEKSANSLKETEQLMSIVKSVGPEQLRNLLEDSGLLEEGTNWATIPNKLNELLEKAEEKLLSSSLSELAGQGTQEKYTTSLEENLMTTQITIWRKYIDYLYYRMGLKKDKESKELLEKANGIWAKWKDFIDVIESHRNSIKGKNYRQVAMKLTQMECNSVEKIQKSIVRWKYELLGCPAHAGVNWSDNDNGRDVNSIAMELKRECGKSGLNIDDGSFVGLAEYMQEISNLSEVCMDNYE